MNGIRPMHEKTVLRQDLRHASCRARFFISFITWLGFIALLPIPAGAIPLFWEQEISAALDSRDSCYREAGIDSSQFKHLAAEPGKIRTDLQDTTTPWYCFLKGLASGDSINAAASWFARAMSATEKDPGKIWVLAVEFDRCEMPAWEEKCLKKLELLFLTSGARASPVIVQQLLYRSSVALSSGNGNDVEFYTGWAQRFDRRCLWPAVFAIELNGILDVPKVSALLRDMWTSFCASWETQLACVRTLSRWLSLMFEFVIAGILLGLIVRYISPALHLWSERFPDILSFRGKLVLALAVFGSFAFLGLIPFVWVCFFVLWRRLAAKDKRLGVIALVIFLLAPLGIKLNDMFDQTLSANSSAELYKKVIDEGYYGPLETVVDSHALHNSNDYLAQTAAALYFCKKGTPLAAFPHLKMAQTLAKDDPIVITTTGNALYYAGDLPGARNAYEHCISLYPGYVPPYFNLGQYYYYGTMETAKGMEYTTQASRMDPEFVDAFIKKNDDYFPIIKDWPPLRQLILPDFTPGYFWKNVFPAYRGSWETTQRRFGALFFGVPLPWYLVLSAVLFILLLVLDNAVWSKDLVRRVASCKVCQKPVCRKCKRGSICSSCFKATQNIRNEQIRQRIMEKIQFRAVRVQSFKAIVLDLVFPGAGLVYNGAPLYQTLPLLLATSMVYALFFSLLHTSVEYPAWAMHAFMVPLYSVIAVYAAIFVIRAVVSAVIILAKRGN
jgi:tetratricopeptide (TPR) repeat protein